jgi:hypothetical protein
MAKLGKTAYDDWVDVQACNCEGCDHGMCLCEDCHKCEPWFVKAWVEWKLSGEDKSPDILEMYAHLHDLHPDMKFEFPNPKIEGV